VVVGGMNTTLTSLYFAKGWQTIKFKFEAAFQSGSTGIQYQTYQPEAGYTQAGTAPINLGGFGMAARLQIMRDMPGWLYGKIVIWLLLAVSVSLLRRKPTWALPNLLGLIALGGIAAYLATYKPF